MPDIEKMKFFMIADGTNTNVKEGVAGRMLSKAEWVQAWRNTAEAISKQLGQPSYANGMDGSRVM